MKKILSFLLIAATLVCTLSLSAHASSDARLSVDERGPEYTYLTWDTDNGNYDGSILQKSADGVKWYVAELTQYNSAYYYPVKNAPKRILYYRVIYFTLQSVTDKNGNEVTKRVYERPSNAVKVYPVFSDFDFYAYGNAKNLNITWSVDSDEVKYIDGFDVFMSQCGAKGKQVANVSIRSFVSKNGASFSYRYTQKAPSPYAYICSCLVKPYYLVAGKKIYLCTLNNTDTCYYTNDNTAWVKTGQNAVAIFLKKLPGNAYYKIEYTKYHLKTGKTYKSVTVNTKKTAYLLPKVNTGLYGYYITVTPAWGKIDSNGVYYNSHDTAVLLNNAPKVKASSIPVINTRGKKSYVDWSYTLTKKDAQIIKNFFYKKYKGKYPSRAVMAEYAINWINKQVKYAYDYGKIENLSNVEAIFVKRYGQCLQYNGAYAAVLTFLGYRARVIEGYRMDGNGKPTVNHFWCEVQLNGRWYLCETGNYDSNGEWMYFVSLYRHSRGYTRNGKLATDY